MYISKAKDVYMTRDARDHEIHKPIVFTRAEHEAKVK